jgi:hypothetical protein
MNRTILALLIVGLVAPAARADERSYLPGTGDAAPLCVLGVDVPVGGACYGVGDVHEPTVRIEGLDSAPWMAGYSYTFVSERPRVLGSGRFCGASPELWVPPGSSRLLVGAAEASGPVACAASGSPGIALGGTSRTTFRIVPAALRQTSPAFDDGARIPDDYTCLKASPPWPELRWSSVPEGTAEMALVMEDPDTPIGTFVHWVIYGLDPSSGGIESGVLPEGAKLGQPYRGPCPPQGDPEHRYIFTLYALSAASGLDAGATPARLRAAISPILLDQARLTGLFSR